MQRQTRGYVVIGTTSCGIVEALHLRHLHCSAATVRSVSPLARSFDRSAESQVVRTRSGADALVQSAELRPELLAPQLLLELGDRLEVRLSGQAYETRRVAGAGIFGANRLVLCLLLRSRLRHGETAPSTELCSE